MKSRHLANSTLPDERGRFGDYGGRFVPETLMPALAELEEAYREASPLMECKHET